MLERVPVDVALAELVRELQHGELVLGRVLAQPVDEVVLLETGLALRAPELGHPRIGAEVVVDPVDVAALDHHLRVVLEVVEDRDGGIARDACRFLAHELEGAEVGHREVVVRAAGPRAQVDAREGVVADVRGDVLARDDRLDERAHLGLRGRERPGTLLLRLGCPVRRPVAVEVETLERRGDRDVHTVPVHDRPLGQDAVEVALDVVRKPRDECARVVRVRLPRSVGIGHAHEENAAVAVDVLAVQPVFGLVARIRADARAAEAAVGEPGLGTVRVHARHDVERAGVDGVTSAPVLGVKEVVE